MSLATAAGRRALGKAYGLFAGALAFLVVVVAVAAQLGLDEAVIAFLVIAFTLVTYAVIGVVTRTLSLTDFYVAGRGVSEGFNGMATAAAFLSGGGLAAIAGAYFADATAALAVTVGWTVGFVLLAVLIAPYYRKSGAVTLPDFLAVRYGNPLIRPVAVVVLLVATFALLPAAIAVGATIIGVFLHVRPEVALAVVFVTLLFSSLFGGMRSVTFVSG
ncbi:MAG: cation acetate symporter, partial [Bauldia sp.]|nr:cation acetate symporter [Bauldia sp.]